MTLWRRIRSRVERGVTRSTPRARCARAHGEEGFTLIELLIVLMILPIIMGGVSMAVITSLKDSAGVQNKIGDSADAQITSAYYVRDVQSATNLTTLPTVTGPAVCGSGAATNPPLLLALYWPGTTGTDTVTSYWLVSTSHASAPTTYQLVRSFCPNASTTSTTPISPSGTSALALDPSGTPQPATVTCATTVVLCTAYTAGWMSTAGISSVALASLESGSVNPYQYNLSAAPRFWNSASGGLPLGGTPFPPLTLLGSGGTVLAISAQNDHVNVIGGIGFNSNSSSAIYITASNSSVSNSPGSPFDVVNCGSPCNVITTTASGDSGPLTPATSVSSSYLTPPVTVPDTSVLPAASCTNSGSTYTCPPGKYSSGAFSFLTSGNSFTVNFSGPASSDAACPYCYELQGQLLASTQNNTLNFGNANTFVLDNGLAVSASGTTLTGTGVFLYVAGGAFAVTAQNNTVELAPQTSGPYAGVVLYQAASDTNTVLISASSNTTDTYGGAVEAPGAAVQITAQSNGLTLGSLIAKSLSISGSGAAVTIG